MAQNEKLRLVGGCVPYKLDTKTGALSFLLVQSNEWHDMAFPKGGWDGPSETLEQTATRETREEAGLQGKVCAYLGSFICPSKKHRTGLLNMYLLQVEEEKASYDESGFRLKKWVQVKDLESVLSKRTDVRQIMAHALASAYIRPYLPSNFVGTSFKADKEYSNLPLNAVHIRGQKT
eukprot:TRINITY_DN99_c9_g1_i1.p1 TRINITY_DN99_c9_g1~~TRINITY_DN99_c9_g1_i1.p1  ORF type:complete len:177 (-),score=41.27 TRINITY_DN99_c9_g1_i1:325-855(-)